MNAILKRGLMTLVVLTFWMTGSPGLWAQDTAKSTIQLAGKTVQQSKGKSEAEKTRILEEALVIYEKIDRRWPEALEERAVAWLKIGGLQRRLGNPEKALAAFDACLTVKGQTRSHVRALQAKASLHRKRKDLEAAKATYLKLIEDCADQDKACAEAELSLGSMALKAKDWKECKRRADRVWENYPALWRQKVKAANLQVRSMIAQREWIKAIATLEDLDQKLEGRFGETEVWPKVQKAMGKMSARKTLTPVSET